MSLFFRAAAQETGPLDGYGIEANIIGGKVIKHNYRFPPVPAFSGGIDINILKQTNGKKEWEQRGRFPQIGLGITYTNYGDNKIFGQCIGLYPVLPIRLARGKKLEWDMKIGIGIGYVTSHYERHPTWDTINNLVGSSINNFTLMATALRYNVDKHLSLHAGITLTHISNGSFQLPNLGVNLAAGSIGIRYFPGERFPTRIVRNLPKRSNRWMFHGRMGIGFSQISGPNGPRYPVYLPSLFVSKRYHGRNRILFGADYTYYKSLENFLRTNEMFPGEEKKQSYQAMVIAGHELMLGRFGLLMQLGVPIKRTYRENEGLYFGKLGYNFYIIQNEQGVLKELSLHTYIKSNKFEADIIEFGVGVGL
jgi:hypothetical protein